MKTRYSLVVWISLTFAVLLPHSLSAEQSCEDIKKLSLPSTAIMTVTSVADSPPWTPSRGAAVNIAICRVEGVIEQQIGFELWLPAPDRWNERLWSSREFPKSAAAANLPNFI